MRNPKSFILIIIFVSVFLLLLDIPKPLKLNFQTKIPFINKKIAISEFLINPQDLNINLGIARIQKNIGYRLGLDLQGGVRLVYKVDMENIPKNERPNAFESARNIIERRINFFGVVETTIQTLKISEDYRVIVELPGITNVDEATSLIGKTAQLSFWEEGATGSPPKKKRTTSFRVHSFGGFFFCNEARK